MGFTHQQKGQLPINNMNITLVCAVRSTAGCSRSVAYLFILHLLKTNFYIVGNSRSDIKYLAEYVYVYIYIYIYFYCTATE